jgi:transcriptional regulator with XRE-family HTH domain
MNFSDLSAADLALASELSPSLISRYLNGKTDIKGDNLLKLLAALEVDLSQILKKELLSRLSGRPAKDEIDDDLALMFHGLDEINQKTILSVILASSSARDEESFAARKRLFEKSKTLAFRKRRYA